jgi:phosphoglycolate phosphatase
VSRISRNRGVENLLFDLDGTLTDSGEGVARCIAYALEELGEKVPPAERLRECVGPPLLHSFRELVDGGGETRARRALELYRERFTRIGMFENRVYPGAERALAALQASGFRLFVATSKPRVYARRILEHFRLARHFSDVYGPELDGRRDDKTELLAFLLEEQSLKPSRTVMIGDRKHDIRGARANGVLPIGVTWGYGSRDELVDAGAMQLVESWTELAELFKGSEATEHL